MSTLTYTTWVADLANLTAYDPADAVFLGILPACINDAEQRLYRELDLLSTVVRDTTILIPNTRTFTLPSNFGSFVVTNGFNVIIPVDMTVPDEGTRVQLTPCSRDVLDRLWPSISNAGVPENYAMITDQDIIVGPAPDQGYTIECIGTIRPTPLSDINPDTYLTMFLPDLFMDASMIFMSGFMRNFGAQADDPKMAASWQAQYDTHFASAAVEELRKKYSVGNWHSMSPAALATPQR